MVDFRPLLFINALALMLLVTAGFASVHKEMVVVAEPSPETTLPPVEHQASAESPPEPEPGPPVEAARSPAVNTEPFTIPSLPEEPTVLAMAEPVAAMNHSTATVAPPEPSPKPETAQLTLRSNVVGDSVVINGKAYGATRLDLELEPGRYEVTISKPGYKTWQHNVALGAGSDLTLVGKLEAYTTVDYRDGTWLGGVRTGDGTYQNRDGLKYEGHFVDGEFHGQGTLTLANGDIRTGQWAEGKLNGHGSLTTADGMLYVGGFRNGEFHGNGTLTYPDGRTYEGQFSNGAFHGSGSEVFADGKKYEGQYINGEFHGKGLLRNPNGSSIEATFRQGEPYGQVRLTTAAGEVFTARTTEPGVCYRDKSYRATQCPKLEGW
nr:PEGA domain-containing protein [uncultured Marinobacter sp.]